MSDMVQIGSLWVAEKVEVSEECPFKADDVLYTGRLGDGYCLLAKNVNWEEESKLPAYYLYMTKGTREVVEQALRIAAFWKYKGEKTDKVSANGKMGYAQITAFINLHKKEDKHPDLILSVARDNRKKPEGKEE
jgi:hypothetical protein